jgi:hypothetical protein
MHPQGGLAGRGTVEQRHGNDQSAQVAIECSIEPYSAMPPTVLVARGDEPLLLHGRRDESSACLRPTDAVPLRWS